MMAEPRTSDLALVRLHALAWSVGSAAFAGPPCVVWVVAGHRTHGEDVIRAEGVTVEEAWRRAVGQAEAIEARPNAV